MKIVLASSETERHFVKRTILGNKNMYMFVISNNSYQYACIYLDPHNTTKHNDAYKGTASIRIQMRVNKIYTPIVLVLTIVN